MAWARGGNNLWFNRLRHPTFIPRTAKLCNESRPRGLLGGRPIPGDFAFDSYFTNAENLTHIHRKKDSSGRSRGYLGDLKTNRKPEWKGGIIKASDLAASIPAADRQEMRIGDKRQWYFTVTVQIPEVKHKVRIVVLWHYRSSTVTVSTKAQLFNSYLIAIDVGETRSSLSTSDRSSIPRYAAALA